MAPVPTTATATDANLERKIILEGNALLKQETDRMRAEHDLYASALSAVREQFKALTGREEPIVEMLDFLKADFVAKKTKLANEIAAHEVRRDTVRTEHAAEVKRHDVVAQVLAAKKAELLETDSTINERRAAMRVEETAHTDKLTVLMTAETAVQKKLDDLNAEIASKAAATADKEKWILEEETRLAMKARDISIYEQRIFEAGKKVDPAFTMIL